MGLAYANKGDYDKAIADSTKPSGSTRSLPWRTPAVAHAYNRKGNYDKAIADCNDAIRLDPKDGFAYYNRGLAYVNRGDHDKAKADFGEAMRLGCCQPGLFTRPVVSSQSAVRIGRK